jgi:hypothetical protein
MKMILTNCFTLVESGTIFSTVSEAMLSRSWYALIVQSRRSSILGKTIHSNATLHNWLDSWIIIGLHYYLHDNVSRTSSSRPFSAMEYPDNPPAHLSNAANPQLINGRCVIVQNILVKIMEGTGKAT